MKCPLEWHQYVAEPVYEDRAVECIKAECAWWSEGAERCAVEAIAGALWAIVIRMEG